MQLPVVLALPGILSVAGAADPIRAADAWTALPTPSLCAPRAAAPRPAPLWDGSHLLRAGDRSVVEGDGSAPRLPVSTLARMIEEDAAARGAKLELFKSTPGLLARGDAAAIEAARALIADLERADERLWIDLEVELSPVGAGATGAPAANGANGTAAAPATGFKSKARMRSGDEAFFGARETRTYIESFEVEVAADSGVVDPILGTAVWGRTLHVSACRVDGGKRVHLSGLLDVSELGGVETFDPSTSDLGLVEEPLVDVVQIAFAGVVDSGAALEVAIAGARLAQGEWKLTVRSTCKPDPERGKDGDAGWALLDLAFLAREAPEPAAFRPGAGLDRLAAWVVPARPTSAVPPSAVAAALDSRRSDSSMSRGARLSLAWTDDLLLVPRSDPAAVEAARDLAHGAEALRLTSNRLELRAGAFSVRLPACDGWPARVLAGRERSFLVDYHAEIAPQTWMPAPDVQKSFDGVAFEARPGAISAPCSFWLATSEKPVETKREAARLGRLQILSRALRGDSAVLALDEAERRFLETGSAPAADPRAANGLGLRFVRP